MFYKEQLESIRLGLQELHADLETELQGLPDGSLLVYDKRGKRYYCQRFRPEGNRKKEHRVSINKDADMILALARKKYVEHALASTVNDIAALDEAIGKYAPVNEESVMASFCAKYPELSKGVFFGKRDAESWAAGGAPNEGFYEEDLKSVSSQGEKMRSGGEMYIASRLDHFGIPYRYEEALGIPDLIYAPDFTILRPRDRKIFYWEHFGMVNDETYVRKNIGKVSDYIDYGIRPWDNFIMTFNNEKGGFNGKLIDAMIDCWLL